MGSFYEIIKNLKTPEEKRKPEKKRTFRIKTSILLLSFLFIMFTSGLGLLIFNSYIKSSLKQKTEPKTTQISQVQISKDIQNSKDIQAPQAETPKVIIVSEKSSKKNLKPFTNRIPPKSIKNESSQISMVPELTDKKEPPLEGFLLTKEDLLNNLLLLAEEERKKGNCKSAIFYYKSYLKEKENPSVMNNLGACLMELGDYDEAINIFNKALSLKNDPEIKYNLIIAYFKKGDKERACRELKNLNANPFLEESIKKLKNLCK